MVVRFADPLTERLRVFLKSNIEDEFRIRDWGLQMSFVSLGRGIRYSTSKRV